MNVKDRRNLSHLLEVRKIIDLGLHEASLWAQHGEGGNHGSKDQDMMSPYRFETKIKKIYKLLLLLASP